VSRFSSRHRLSPPSAFLELHALLQDATIPAARLAGAMLALPDLAAEVLRLANSSTYGMERTVDRLDRAVSLVSPKVLRNLVLTMAMGRASRGMPDLGGELSPGWLRDHLLAVARVAGLVARAANLPLEEEARTAGIVHDVGMIELSLRDPDELRRAHDDAALAGAPTTHFERDRLGVDHAELGREMVESWGLPESIVHAVASHHAPLGAPEGMRYLPCVLAVAESLCESDGGTTVLPVAPEILRALELTVPEWHGLVPTLRQLVTTP
jgi:putative nucleotidyltransferase with HDIG domain